MKKGDKVRARVSKTNRFREVTLRRDAKMKEDELGLYTPTPAYFHNNELGIYKTISGRVYETDYDKWVFIPTGKNEKLWQKQKK